MNKFLKRIQDSIKIFFSGEEGSVFYVIGWTIQFVKEVVAAINEKLREAFIRRDQQLNKNRNIDEDQEI